MAGRKRPLFAGAVGLTTNRTSVLISNLICVEFLSKVPELPVRAIKWDVIFAKAPNRLEL